MKKSLKFAIGFSDSELLSYQQKSGKFTAFLKMWNGVEIQIEFSEVTGVNDLGVGDISNFVEDENTPFLNSILSKVYEIAPTSHPYRSFQFLDLDDNPVLEIIAVSLKIHAI